MAGGGRCPCTVPCMPHPSSSAIFERANGESRTQPRDRMEAKRRRPMRAFDRVTGLTKMLLACTSNVTTLKGGKAGQKCAGIFLLPGRTLQTLNGTRRGASSIRDTHGRLLPLHDTRYVSRIQDYPWDYRTVKYGLTPYPSPSPTFSIEKRFIAFHSQACARTHPLPPYASQE